MRFQERVMGVKMKRLILSILLILCFSLNIQADTGDLVIEGKSITGTLLFDTGTSIDEFSIDGTFAGNSDNAIPTEAATKTYVDAANYWVNVEDYGVDTGETGANNQTYLTDVIAGISAGDVIVIPPGTYTVLGLWTISEPCTIMGYGANLDFSTNAADQGIRITASDVHIYGLEIEGSQYAASVSTQRGIDAYGADSSNYISGLKIVDCNIHDWGFYGLLMRFVDGFLVEGNDVVDIYRAGITGLSVQNGHVATNYVDHMIDSPCAYGIMMSRYTTDAGELVTYPRSSDVEVFGNIVKNVVNWEGLDTHGGERIKYENNLIVNCAMGIMIGPCDNNAAVATYAALDCTAIGNTIISGSSSGTAKYGISFIGCAAQDSTGIVSGNIVKQFGNSTYYMGTYFHSTKGLTVTDNVIVEPYRYGMGFIHSNDDFDCSDNTIIDPWTTAVSSMGIAITSTNNTGIVQGNILARGSKAAGNVADIGIYVGNQVGTSIDLGINYFQGFTTEISDAGSKTITNILSGGSHAVGINYNAGGTGGLQVFDGTTDFTFASNSTYPLNIYDGAGTLLFEVTPAGVARIRSDTAQLYFDIAGTHRIYRSGNDVYWYDGSAATKLNVAGGISDIV